MLKVLLAGGGSGGSSAPVLAVAEELRSRGPAQFLYVGTAEGPERELAVRMGIPFRAVQTGKLRRYWSVQNFTDLFRLPLGLAQSLAIVRSFRPHVAFAAGGFGAVPPLLAASLLRVPVVVHQQDVEPGLANRILAPFASAITVTFPNSLAHFPAGKTRVTGNPVRAEVLSGRREEAWVKFGLEAGVPTVLVTGGGTGAAGINHLVSEAAPSLVKECQILHITGRGKAPGGAGAGPRHVRVEFLAEGMGHALAAADLVVSRAGLSTLTELAALEKPSLLIPMPDSHQDANAAVFSEADAAVVVRQADLTPTRLAKLILGLLSDPLRLAHLGKNAGALMPPNAQARIADAIARVARNG